MAKVGRATRYRRILALLVCAWGVHASAATFTVTNLSDAGPGSLRDAVNQANTNPGADTVDFAVTGTITLTGQITIHDALTVQGPGAANLTVDGAGINRVFYIGEVTVAPCPDPSGPPFAVTLSGMTIRNGMRHTDNTGGGIFSYKTLTLAGVVVRDNVARSGGGLSFAVQYPGQALTITDSQFVGNSARPLSATSSGSSGGAIFVNENCGIAIENTTISISRTLFQDNTADPVDFNGRAGALWFNGRQDIFVSDSRFLGNAVNYPAIPVARTWNGGAIFGRAKQVTISGTEFSENFADTASAIGIFNDTAAFQSPADAVLVKIVNSTISGNAAGTSVTVFGFGNVAFDIANTTIAGNRAAQTRTSGIAFNTGPTVPPTAANALPPSLKLRSSILWNPGDSYLDFAKNNVNIPGPFTIEVDQSIYGKICTVCDPITVTGSGNLPGVDPLLLPLSNNGGATRTHPLQLGSRAIGTGSNPLALVNDQRGTGFARQVGAATDMGAVEYIYPPLCANLNDVPGDNPFCANVAWIKNRGVTQGCLGGNYCPDDSVIRLQMAAFMNRLGTALSPTVVSVEAEPGSLDFANAPLVCQTGPISAGNAPKRITVDGVFSGLAGADSYTRMLFVISRNGGSTWTELNYSSPRATSQANAWTQLHYPGSYDMPAGETARFALKLDRSNTTEPSGVLQSTCHLRLRIDPSHDFSVF